jgi:hypothetical protein
MCGWVDTCTGGWIQRRVGEKVSARTDAPPLDPIDPNTSASSDVCSPLYARDVRCVRGDALLPLDDVVVPANSAAASSPPPPFTLALNCEPPPLPLPNGSKSSRSADLP